MKRMIIASNNKGKIAEIKNILYGNNIQVLSLSDMNINIDVEENGHTFAENAKKKAVEIAEYLISNGEKDFFVLSDDSGLCVDYLNGEPGVYSARYAGIHGDDKANNRKLLEKLMNVQEKDRTGRFICSMALVDSNLNFNIVEGSVEGIILQKEEGQGGFGYDPLFFSLELNKSFGVATSEEKNTVSHRGKALKKLKSLMVDML